MSDNKKINILHLVPSLSAGGVESLVVGLLENIDHNKFHFDIAVLNSNQSMHEEKLKDLGANIHYISNAGSRSSIFSKVTWRIHAISNFRRLIFTNDIDVFHCHYYNMYGPFVLLAALKGIPVRIVHAHTVGIHDNVFTRIIRKLHNFFNLNFLVTSEIGCSNAAVKWFFGNGHFKQGRSKTIYNGIDMQKFTRIDVNKKLTIRNAYQLKHGTHFIHVGRFTSDKNDLFLVRSFYEMTKRLPDLYLNIIGYGPGEKQMKDLIAALNIEHKVRFFKYNSNVPEILSAMDYFLLPSLKEGLSIVAIESQCSGIPIFISDRVTREVDMGLAVYLTIDSGPEYWAEKILKMIDDNSVPKKLYTEKIKQFDIKYTVKQFEQVYQYKGRLNDFHNLNKIQRIPEKSISGY